MYSVREFAEAKGLSRERVYDLIRSNELPHVKVGKILLIDDAAMAWSPQPSRPLSPRMARSLLNALEGHPVEGLRDAERARLRRYLHQLKSSPEPEALLSSYLRRRAEVWHLVAARSDLPDLRSDARLKLSGVSAKSSHMSASDAVEAYISEEDLPKVKREYLLRDGDPASENVRLRVMAIDDSPGDGLVAADLADWARPRERRQARRLLEALFRRSEAPDAD